MQGVISNTINKIRRLFWNEYDVCYQNKEDAGVAVFGMCGGAWIKQKELCSKCPYWVGKAGGKDAGSI